MRSQSISRSLFLVKSVQGGDLDTRLTHSGGLIYKSIPLRKSALVQMTMLFDGQILVQCGNECNKYTSRTWFHCEKRV